MQNKAVKVFNKPGAFINGGSSQRGELSVEMVLRVGSPLWGWLTRPHQTIKTLACRLQVCKETNSTSFCILTR